MSTPIIRERVLDLKLLTVGVRLNVGPKGRDESDRAYKRAIGELQAHLHVESIYPIESPRLTLIDDPRRLPAGRRGPWWDRYATGRLTVRACAENIGHVPPRIPYTYVIEDRYAYPR